MDGQTFKYMAVGLKGEGRSPLRPMEANMDAMGNSYVVYLVAALGKLWKHLSSQLSHFNISMKKYSVLFC